MNACLCARLSLAWRPLCLPARTWPPKHQLDPQTIHTWHSKQRITFTITVFTLVESHANLTTKPEYQPRQMVNNSRLLCCTAHICAWVWSARLAICSGCLSFYHQQLKTARERQLASLWKANQLSPFCILCIIGRERAHAASVHFCLYVSSSQQVSVTCRHIWVSVAISKAVIGMSVGLCVSICLSILFAKLSVPTLIAAASNSKSFVK